MTVGEITFNIGLGMSPVVVTLDDASGLAPLSLPKAPVAQPVPQEEVSLHSGDSSPKKPTVEPSVESIRRFESVMSEGAQPDAAKHPLRIFRAAEGVSAPSVVEKHSAHTAMPVASEVLTTEGTEPASRTPNRPTEETLQPSPPQTTQIEAPPQAVHVEAVSAKPAEGVRQPQRIASPAGFRVAEGASVSSVVYTPDLPEKPVVAAPDPLAPRVDDPIVSPSTSDDQAFKLSNHLTIKPSNYNVAEEVPSSLQAVDLTQDRSGDGASAPLPTPRLRVTNNSAVAETPIVAGETPIVAEWPAVVVETTAIVEKPAIAAVGQPVIAAAERPDESGRQPQRIASPAGFSAAEGVSVSSVVYTPDLPEKPVVAAPDPLAPRVDDPIVSPSTSDDQAFKLSNHLTIKPSNYNVAEEVPSSLQAVDLTQDRSGDGASAPLPTPRLRVTNNSAVAETPIVAGETPIVAEWPVVVETPAVVERPTSAVADTPVESPVTVEETSTATAEDIRQPTIDSRSTTDYQTIKPSNYQTIKPSNHQTIKLSNHNVAEEVPSKHPTVESSNLQPSDLQPLTFQPSNLQPLTQPATPAPAAPEVASASAATARTETIVETVEKVVEAVVGQMVVTPGIAQGDGNVRITLKPTVLDGSEISLTAKDGTLSVAIVPATPEAARLAASALPRLEAALAEHVPAFRHVAVTIVQRKEKADEAT